MPEYAVEVEREGLAEELARLDVDLPTVTIEGEVYRQGVRCEETYTSAAGPVRVIRSLYRRGCGGEGERTVCPLELRAGMVEGRWTPLAAPGRRPLWWRIWRHRKGRIYSGALHQSARFERSWKLLSGTYKRTVMIPENVVLFPKRTVH